MRKYYQIAGLKICMDVFGRLDTQSIPYETESTDNIDIYVEPDIEDLKRKFPDLSDDSYLYMATGKDFGEKLLKFNGIRIHSSAVIMNGRAYLFSANSGTGKSTHTSLWRRVFGDEKVRVLNDDMPVIRLENGIWYAYGNPWSGKTGLNTNMCVPLGGIAFLERGTKNEIAPCSGAEAVHLIYGQGPNPKSAQLRERMLDLLGDLIVMIPIWKLKCNMEPEAAIVSYEAMSGEKWRN